MNIRSLISKIEQDDPALSDILYLIADELDKLSSDLDSVDLAQIESDDSDSLYLALRS